MSALRMLLAVGIVLLLLGARLADTIVDALLDVLPGWVGLLLLVATALAVLRAVSSLFIGPAQIYK